MGCIVIEWALIESHPCTKSMSSSCVRNVVSSVYEAHVLSSGRYEADIRMYVACIYNMIQDPALSKLPELPLSVAFPTSV
jgi:hypothetical protein